jgi:hypothetical protein
MRTQMFCPPFATSLPQSEYKVASTQSKNLSNMVGRHMEARRKWNKVVSMKNRSQSSHKK